MIKLTCDYEKKCPCRDEKTKQCNSSDVALERTDEYKLYCYTFIGKHFSNFKERRRNINREDRYEKP